LWQEQSVDDLRLVFTPSKHFSGRGLFDRMKTLWGSFIIQSQDYTIYFAGDTGYGKHFRQIFKRFGPIDLAFLPIGAYEPRWFMKDVHLNPEEAVKAHLDLGAKKSIGIHFGTFVGLTDEGIEEPKSDLLVALKKHDVPKEMFVVPKFGEVFVLKDKK
jgi:Predicted Zn-dependent hydrolases of the beta-lactamase fold